jgi:hypothetical protein
MPSKTNKIIPTLVVLGLFLTGAVISISVFYSEASLTKHVPWLASIEALLGFNQQPSSQSIAREILAKRLPPVLDFKTQETITVAVKAPRMEGSANSSIPKSFLFPSNGNPNHNP